MDEKEIKTLAAKVADSLYSHFGDRGSVEMMAGEFEAVIKEIVRTHFIVSRSKVLETYKVSKKCNRETSWAEIYLMRDLFGKDELENLYKTQQP